MARAAAHKGGQPRAARAAAESKDSQSGQRAVTEAQTSKSTVAPEPRPAKSATARVGASLSTCGDWVAVQCRTVIGLGVLLAALSALSVTATAAVPSLEGLSAALKAADTVVFALHALYQAFSYRREVDGYPGTGLLRRFVVPNAAAMAGTALQACVLGRWASLAKKLRKVSGLLVACWASVTLLPGPAWFWLSSNPSVVPSLARSAIHYGEACTKASGMMSIWNEMYGLASCGHMPQLLPNLPRVLMVGGARGAASTWVRAVDQCFRGGQLRRKGISSAYLELQRYAVVTLFACWCFLTACALNTDSSVDMRGGVLGIVASLHPAVLVTRFGKESVCGAQRDFLPDWIPTRICDIDQHELLHLCLYLSCLAYLVGLYGGKAQPQRHIVPGAPGKAAGGRKSE